MKNLRNKINSIGTAIGELKDLRNKLTKEYIEQCKKDEAPMIYISNHAIYRYLERVVKWRVNEDMMTELRIYDGPTINNFMSEIRKMFNETYVVKNNLNEVKSKIGDFKLIFNGLTLVSIIES